MKKLDAPEKVIFICNGKKCGKYCKELRKSFKSAIKESGLKKEIEVGRMECTDNCRHAPVISLQPLNIWIGEVSEKDVEELLKEYI